jgi:glycosyltransferase involved in cell wall biosynthesis
VRILAITAGAGQMYCGTCLRDNALAAELIRQGHDVVLVPIYTPTLTDEKNVSQERVFFGGISVYLQQHLALFRKLPLFDRILDSRWMLERAAKSTIPVNPKFLGEMTVSMLRGENGRLKREFDKLVDWIRSEPPPEIIDLPFSLLIALAAPLKRALARPVCCTLQGEDLFLNGLIEPYRSEALGLIRSQTGAIDVFIAPSEYYAGFMSDYLSIPRERIQVVPLGINLEGHEPLHESFPEFRVGYLARIAPEKGLHVLCEAVSKVPAAHLHAAGYLAPENRGYLADLQARYKFKYHGSLTREQKIRFLQSIDVLSVPSTYDEPKGLFLFEAMANGVPVVQPRRGAYPEIVERTGGGILVDNEQHLTETLELLSIDPLLVSRLGRQAFEGVHQHHSIARMAERTLAVYRSVQAGHAVRH